VVKFLLWFLIQLGFVWLLYLAANATLIFPPLGGSVPIRIARTVIEGLCMGVIIGMTTGINLAFWVMLPIPGSTIISLFALIGLLAVFPLIAVSRVFQVFAGWSAWLMPLSLLATAAGLLLFIVFLPFALAAFGPSALLFNPLQGNIQLTVNLSALTGSPGFSIGNFNFLTPGPPVAGPTASTVFVMPGSPAHEAGHTMNTSVLGVFFLIVNAIDENWIPGRQARSWGELFAESNRPRPRWIIGLWS